MTQTTPKCHDCGKFCRPVQWKMLYSGALPEPQEEIFKCAGCVEKHGSFEPQPGIKPEHSCGLLTPANPNHLKVTGSSGDCVKAWEKLRREGWKVSKPLYWEGRGRSFRAAIEFVKTDQMPQGAQAAI